MPLSEHEQRLLDEMERSLTQSDGDVVASVERRHGRPAYRMIVLGVLLAVLGIVALLVGVILNVTIVGIVGFVVMFLGVLVAVASPRRARGPASVDHGLGSPSRASQPGFMDKLNDRWDKRQHGGH